MNNKVDQIFTQVIFDAGSDVGFIRQIVPDNVRLTVAICQQRQEGKAIRQIAYQLSVPKSTVHDHCKTCPEIFKK